jgi:hypothetical protein
MNVPAEGQILIEGQKFKIGKYSKTNSFQKGRTEFKTKVNFNKDQCIKVIRPLM